MDLTLQKADKDMYTSMRKLFNSHEGMYVLSYLKKFYIEESSYDDNPYRSAYKSGRQDMVRELLSLADDIEKIPDIKLITEEN